VVFYRGAWCPYCNITLSHYQARLHATLVERGIELIAISPQTPNGSLTIQEKNELAFTVLSDPGNTLARHLGILTAPSHDVRAAQLQLGLDLISVNADGSTALPMPTTIILDAGHILQWIDVHPDYTTRSEADDIAAALEAAGL
jgi:peroxiredoxin